MQESGCDINASYMQGSGFDINASYTQGSGCEINASLTISRRQHVMARPRASRSSSHCDERWEVCRGLTWHAAVFFNSLAVSVAIRGVSH